MTGSATVLAVTTSGERWEEVVTVNGFTLPAE